MSVIWVCDLDGTGSLHACSKGDPGAIAYVPMASDRLERIATAAMQGIVSDAGTVAKMMMSVGHNDDAHYQLTAKVSLGYARALIAELDSGKSNCQ